MAKLTNSSPELALLATRLDRAFAGKTMVETSPKDIRDVIFREAKLCGLSVKKEGRVFLEKGKYVIADWTFDFIDSPKDPPKGM